MPPKKKTKLSVGQRQLTDIFKPKDKDEKELSASKSETETKNETENIQIENETHEINKDKKVEHADCTSKPSTSSTDSEGSQTKCDRKFQQQWLKSFSWLAYETDEDGYMYCTVCTNNKKKTGLTKDSKCKNYRTTTLTRHEKLAEHIAAASVPELSKNFQKTIAKGNEKIDCAASTLLKVTHWICTEGIPLSKFQSLLDLLHDVGVTDIALLRQRKIHYESAITASDMLEALSAVLEDNIKHKLDKSPFVTALADESTDIANNKRLVIYAQVVSPETMKPETHFISNTECEDTTGSGIAKAILKEFDAKDVQPDRILSLGSDGASVMTGKKAGI